MSLKVVFWGNSQSIFSRRHLEALMDAPCEVAALVDLPPARQGTTNPLPAGLSVFDELARQKKMTIFSPAAPNAPRFVEEMQTLAPDLFIAVGYALILKPALLAVPKVAAVNFHASLLPHYRGKHPVFWTLRGGEVWAGLTVHRMDPGIDTGDIIYQVKVRTRRDDSVASLYDRIMERGAGLVGKLVIEAEEGRLPRKSQPAGEGSYYSSTTPADFRIDWGWLSEKIRRHIVMTPGKCFARVTGRRVYFSQAEKVRDRPEDSPGTLLKLGRGRCTIVAGDGAVSIGRGRLEGGQEQALARLFRRLGIKVGDRLL
jgi:methionyl-tRNA formyltransferase